MLYFEMKSSETLKSLTLLDEAPEPLAHIAPDVQSQAGCFTGVLPVLASQQAGVCPEAQRPGASSLYF